MVPSRRCTRALCPRNSRRHYEADLRLLRRCGGGAAGLRRSGATMASLVDGLGIHGRPVGSLNVEGYWDGLGGLIEHAVREGFVSPRRSTASRPGERRKCRAPDSRATSPVARPPGREPCQCRHLLELLLRELLPEDRCRLLALPPNP